MKLLVSRPPMLSTHVRLPISRLSGLGFQLCAVTAGLVARPLRATW